MIAPPAPPPPPARFSSVPHLVVAGAAKLFRPRETALALRLSGLPASSLGVRLGALVEIGVATGAMFTGSPVLCLAVGLSYLAFATFVGVALVRGLPLSSCGCLGEPDSPPTATHVVLDLVLAQGALWARWGVDYIVRCSPSGVGRWGGVAVVVCRGYRYCLTTLGQLGAESRSAPRAPRRRIRVGCAVCCVSSSALGACCRP